MRNSNTGYPIRFKIKSTDGENRYYSKIMLFFRTGKLMKECAAFSQFTLGSESSRCGFYYRFWHLAKPMPFLCYSDGHVALKNSKIFPIQVLFVEANSIVIYGNFMYSH